MSYFTKPRVKDSFPLLVLIFLCFLAPAALAQKTLKGRVLEYPSKEPIPYASVFLINTTLGATADENGVFSIQIPDGSYEVIVRMLGYESVTFPVNTNTIPPQGYQVQLLAMDEELDEIEVEEKRDPIWYRNLEYFKRYFLGETKNGRAVKIENELDLLLDRETNRNILDVNAKKALILDNPNLGYEIEFLLINFQYNFRENSILYKGYPLFKPYENLSKGKQQRIEKNRDEAYLGSLQHFIHSLYLGKTKEDGFELRRIMKVPNPEKPSKEAMEEAAAAFKRSYSQEVRDSLQINYLSKSRLPDEISVLDITQLDPEVLLQRQEDGRVFLKLKDQLQITYTKEGMAPEYPSAPMNRSAKTPQVSKLRLTQPSVEIFLSGSFEDPLGIMMEDYMAWERVGDLMPYDYLPTNERSSPSK